MRMDLQFGMLIKVRLTPNTRVLNLMRNILNLPKTSGNFGRIKID